MNLKLYRHKLRQSLSIALSHRLTSFVIVVFGFMFIFIEFAVGLIYFQGSDVLLGLSKEHYFFFVSTFNLISYLYQFLFTLAHEELSEKIIKGDLDYVVVRPLNSFFYYALSRVDFPSLPGVIVSACQCLLFYPKAIKIHDAAFVLFMIAMSVIFVFVLNQLLISAIFWLEKNNRLTEVPEYLMSFAARPKRFFPTIIQRVFTSLIPAFTATNSILDYLNGQLNWGHFVWFVVYTSLMVVLSYHVWNKGMRKYQSAN